MNEPTSVGRVASRIGREVIWAPIAVVLIHAAAGHLFGHEPYVDPVMHFLGGGAAAFFFWQACSLAGQFLGRPNFLALDLLAFGLAAVAALVWELGEFASDVFLGTLIQHDVANTFRDLFLGVAGAAVYLGAARIMRRRLARAM